jgi:membrane-associated PAP2 superfamily phosphatase
MKARHRERIALLGLATAASVVFELWPRLDLWLTAHFYAGAGRFPANDLTLVQLVYVGVPWAGLGLLLATLALLAWAARRQEQVPRRAWRRAAALALVLLLGAGALVNGALKEQWGRPRPREVEAFAGAHPFVPALHPSLECAHNCSFVSGHAATGFALIALGVFGSRAARRQWWRIGVAVGVAVGAVRVVQGAHFLSDVVFCLLFMWASCMLLREAWLRAMVLRRRHAGVGTAASALGRPPSSAAAS